MTDTNDEITTSAPMIEGIDCYVFQLLAKHRKIAVIWSNEDVQEVRPDLTDDQAWQVLLEVERRNDAELGINWQTLERVAEELFGDAPETGDGEDPF